MKTTPKFIQTSILVGAFAVFAPAVLQAQGSPSHHRGTDILHLSLSKSVTNDTVASGANGTVSLKYRKQGHSTVQSLDLSVSGLDAQTSYVLLSSTVSDSTLVPGAVLQTDDTGLLKVRYSSVVTGNGNVHPVGKAKTPLPAELNPLAYVRSLVLADSVVTQALVGANLEAPDKLNYLLKRDVSSETVPASLQLTANNQRGQFKFQAWDLAPTNDYLLVLNGEVTQVITTDAKGRWTARFAVENPLDVLALRTVEIWDSSSNSVLTVSLP
jgi:hypothetical protein